MAEAPDLRGISVLVMDGDAAFVESFKSALEGYGAPAFSASSLKEAVGIVYSRPLDAVLAGFDLLGEAPESFINEFRTKNPGGLFFLLMEAGTEVMASDPSGLLVAEYFQKPLTPERFARTLEPLLKDRGAGDTALEVLDPVLSRARPYLSFRSPAMREALKDLPRIAASDQTVLISGETGTGKEIVSHAIHVMSPRAEGPFVAINCGAIPEGLIEGELFGHERGAFTGAHRAKKGKFEVAHMGTLLLDEIGDMPLQLQMRLLRVLEERRVTRIGGESARAVNVRVIAASLRDLKDEAEKGLFRSDLYYRLNVLKIHLPRLAERVEDIALLAVNFMDRAFMEMGMRHPLPKLSGPAIELLERLPWRGNVRELRNVMTRVATFLPRGARQVLPMHVIPHLEDGAVNVEGGRACASGINGRAGEGVFIPAGTSLKDAEEMLIGEAIRAAGGNRTLAARRLGIGIRTLRRRLNKG